MAATRATAIRLTPAAKRRIVAAARRAGESPSKYISTAALARATAGPDTPAGRLARLERRAAALQEAVEDEIDVRIGDAAWERHLATGTRLRTGEEVWRELRLPD
jgi:hypothetical protein